MLAIFKREFKSYFQNVIGWLFVAALLAVYGLYFYVYNLKNGYPYISYDLKGIGFIMMIAVPILTMRSLSDEKKTKTDQLMLTSPVSVGKIVAGKYFAMAESKKGITGENLLQILESRLDNVVYRLGYGSSRAQARMLVTHGIFDVNGKKVNIPSYLVKAGDVISVREIKKDNGAIKLNVEMNSGKPVPEWLEKDAEKLSGKVVRLASREDVDIPVEEHLIVELYSK